MNLKLERRHVAGLNRAQGKSAQVLAVGHGKAMPIAVSRLQVGAPTGPWPVGRSARYREFSMNRSAGLRPGVEQLNQRAGSEIGAPVAQLMALMRDQDCTSKPPTATRQHEIRMSGWLRKGVHLGVTLLVLFLTTLPAVSDVSVKFSRWETEHWESVRELAESHPGQWTQEADCLRAGENEIGVLNLLHRSIDAADVTVEWTSDATGRRRSGQRRRVGVVGPQPESRNRGVGEPRA